MICSFQGLSNFQILRSCDISREKQRIFLSLKIRDFFILLALLLKQDDKFVYSTYCEQCLSNHSNLFIDVTNRYAHAFLKCKMGKGKGHPLCLTDTVFSLPFKSVQICLFFSSYLYLTDWGQNSGILRCYLDGTGCVTMIALTGHPNFIDIEPLPLSHDQRRMLYWTDSRNDKIWGITESGVLGNIELTNAR